MQLSDFELEVIQNALDDANKADEEWADIVKQWQFDSGEVAAEKMRQAREAYYQKTANLHTIIRKILLREK